MMAEQAVNDKEEVKDLHEAIERMKEDHRIDFQREKEAWDEADRASKQRIAELEEHLGGYVAECKGALAKQEMQAEMERLRCVESVREKFDLERDMYLERIKKLERSLAVQASREDLGGKPKPDASLTSLGGELVHEVTSERVLAYLCREVA